MSEWEDRIRGHRVWNQMETLGPAIDDAISIEDLTPETIGGLERLKTVLTYCGKRLAAADPLVTVPRLLDSIFSDLDAVNSEVIAFSKDKDPTHVTTANQNADAVLLVLAQIPGAYSPEELGALVSSSTEYRATVQKARKDLQHFNANLNESLLTLKVTSDEERGKLQSQWEATSKEFAAKLEVIQVNLSQLSASIQSEQQRLAQVLSDQQGQFSTAQESRNKEFSDAVRLGNENLTKLVAEYQSQFSAAQNARSSETAAAEVARQNKFSDLITDFSKKLADQDAEFTKQRAAFVIASETDLGALVSEFRLKATEILGDIEKKQEHVEKLVGVIGNLGVTSGYLRVANQAKLGVWLWQFATVGSLGMLSFLAYKTLGVLEGADGHFNWGGFAARALLLLSLGVIAAYSGSQADKLFGVERRNRKLALELEAIGPYLAPLPVDEQNKFRLQMGELSFGRDTEHHEPRKSPVSVFDILKSKENKEFLQLLIEMAVKAKNEIK